MNILIKRIIACTVLGISTASADVSPERLMRIGILPQDRAGVDVARSERNPFARRGENKEVTRSSADRNDQEMKIREILSQLRVSGVSEGTNGKRVLVGDMILEEGKVVPPLLANQTARLVVSDVREDRIELSWVERTRSMKARKLYIPIDLTPSVKFLLKGQIGKEDKHMGVLKFSDGEAKVRASDFVSQSGE